MARMAGQFAKPRSQQTEIKNTEEIPSYLGDIINDIIFDSAKRRPAPERMLKAFSQSKKTLEIIRNFELKGSADFHDVSAWNLNFIEKKRQEKKYPHLTKKIMDSIKFMETLGRHRHLLLQNKTNYFTCHEALLLPYEESLVRKDSLSGELYCSSAHFLWIGDRTRFINSAHVEFCR